MKENKKYSRNIKKLRLAVKYTQAELGSICNKSLVDISRYENGHVSPSYITAKLLYTFAELYYPGKYKIEDFFNLT